MLNCTDVDCILHHHHYYHHVHQYQHHLQDHREHHVMSGETEVRDEIIKGLLNDTGSELSDLSHLDAPNESGYMICGVLIAMVLVALIIVLLAVTISKLRKRDDNQHTAVHPQDVVLQTTTASATTTVATIPLPGEHLQTQANGTVNGLPTHPPPFLWQYPARYSVYSNDQDTLVHSLPTEQPGFCRGFRKNLRGRWRRLVKRKPTTEMYTIPAELRDQLKQIYVY